MVKYGLALTMLTMVSVDGYSSRWSSSSSFVSRPSFAASSSSSSTNGAALTMLVEPKGRDALAALAGEGEERSVGALARRAPPAVRRAVSLASVPVGALAGFALTPSRRLVANVVGGAAAAALGSVGRSRLDDWAATTAAGPAVARVLLENGFPDDVSSDEAATAALRDEVRDAAADHGLADEDDLRSVLAHDVYAAYLVSMVRSPLAKTSDLTELSKLRSVLALPALDVGDAHHAAATEFYRTVCLFTPEEELRDDPAHPDRLRLDRLLWLSERAFRAVETTEEAVRYELGRVARALRVTDVEAVERARAVAEPFYRRALASTRAKLDSDKVTPDMLARARTSLGVDDFAKRDMHTQCYLDELKSLLGTTDEGEDGDEGETETVTAFPEGALERLRRLQEILEIPDEDARYELANEVTPLFQRATADVFDRAAAGVGDPASLWREIADRRAELCLDETTGAPLLDSAVAQRLGAPLENAAAAARVANERGVRDLLLVALDVKDALLGVLAAGGETTEEELTDKFFSPGSATSACGFLPVEDRERLYSLFAARDLKDRGDDDGGGRAPEVARLLAMTDDDVADAARANAGPLLEAELRRVALELTGDDWTPALADNLAARLDRLVRTTRAPPSLLREYAVVSYREALDIVALKNPVPSAADRRQLESLRTVLSLDLERDASSLHAVAFGAVYKKSVQESMGATGVVLEAYRAPLEQLVERLELDQADARRLYLEAVADRLKPMVRLLANELERSLLTQEQLAKKTGKDQGQDVFKDGDGPKGVLGLGADGNIMSNIMNLVDFYEENDVPETRDGQTVYPVTAIGVGAVETDMANALYRQFLVGGLTSQSPDQQARYEAKTAALAGVLGLTEDQTNEIGGDIGAQVYENFVRNALRTKDALDQQDMMFLANLRTKLGLDEDRSTDLMLAAQKKVVSDLAADVFAAPTAAAVRKLRDRLDAAGLDPVEDVGLPPRRLETLFAVEVLDGVDRGVVTPANAGETLAEVQESLGLSTDVCERVLETLVGERTKAALSTIENELLRGRDANCAPEIRTLLKFAAFVGGHLDGVLEVEEETANRIVNIFESMDFGDEDPEIVRMSQDLLRTTVGLNDDDDDDFEDDDLDLRKDAVVSPFSSDAETASSSDAAAAAKTDDAPLVFDADGVDRVLDQVRPYLVSDGGNVSVHSVDPVTKNVYLVLEGACGSCPSSTVTMKMGIERVLREAFPDLGEVSQVEPPEPEAPTELTREAVEAEVKRMAPAIGAMGAVVEIMNVDPVGVVEMSFRGSNKIRTGLEMALLDVPFVKHVKFLS